MRTVWTDRRIAVLKQLWAEGKTATAIAEHLGGVSRVAVLGKVFRLRLGPPGRVEKTSRRAGAEKLIRRQSGRPPGIASAKRPSGKTLFELDNGSCRFPIGEPGTPGFHFCGASGADLENGRPYCEQHAKRAYLRGGKSAGSMPGMAVLRDLLAITSPSTALTPQRRQRIVAKTPRRRA